MSKSLIFLLLLFAFIIGVALRSFFSVSVLWLWVISVVAAIFFVFGVLQKTKAVSIYGFLFLAFLLGILRYDMRERSLPDPSRFYGQFISVKGFVSKDPEIRTVVQGLRVIIEAVDGEDIQPFYSFVTLRKHPEYKIGDELVVRGLLEQPENYSDFDYVGYLGREDIFSVMAFPEVEKISEGRGNKLLLVLSKIKHAFEENIDRSLPEPHASFLKGLTLGEREFLPQNFVESLKRTGTTHIIALSGYNITLVGRFFMTLLFFLALPFQAAFWVASVGIVLFIMLTGASPSVVRAGIMGVLVLVAGREGRLYNMRNALALAGAAMIFHNPKILRFDAAFQLSFLATVGLVYLSPHVDKFLERFFYRIKNFLGLRRKLLTGAEKANIARKKRESIFQFRKIFIETLSAQLMVLPLLIYLFGSVSIISPVSNLLILIAVPWSMVLGFITGGLGFLWQPLADISGWVNWAFLEYKIRIIELFGALPVVSIEVGKLAIIPVLTVYILVFFRIIKRRKISARKLFTDDYSM